jgi:hypothetical protein
MNTKLFAKLAFATFVISAAAATQASDITEFPLNTASKLSRVEVQADALKASQPKGEIGFSYDTATLARESRSSSSRMQVKMEKPASKSEKMADAYFVGGM